MSGFTQRFTKKGNLELKLQDLKTAVDDFAHSTNGQKAERFSKVLEIAVQDIPNLMGGLCSVYLYNENKQVLELYAHNQNEGNRFSKDLEGDLDGLVRTNPDIPLDEMSRMVYVFEKSSRPFGSADTKKEMSEFAGKPSEKYDTRTNYAISRIKGTKLAGESVVFGVYNICGVNVKDNEFVKNYVEKVSNLLAKAFGELNGQLTAELDDIFQGYEQRYSHILTDEPEKRKKTGDTGMFDSGEVESSIFKADLAGLASDADKEYAMLAGKLDAERPNVANNMAYSRLVEQVVEGIAAKLGVKYELVNPDDRPYFILKIDANNADRMDFNVQLNEKLGNSKVYGFKTNEGIDVTTLAGTVSGMLGYK